MAESKDRNVMDRNIEGRMPEKDTVRTSKSRKYPGACNVGANNVNITS